MNLTLDFETRSKIDLKKVGAYVYSRHPSTEIICLSVKVDDEPSRIWLPKKFENIVEDLLGPGWNCKPRISQHDMEAALTVWKAMPKLSLGKLKKLLAQADQIHAHNAAFEIAMWNKMESLYKIPCPPMSKWRCTAALAASYALPRSLEGAGEALGLSVKKNKSGHSLMLKMCKPRKPSAGRPELWNETAPELIRLADYCLQDTEAEWAIDQSLRPMPRAEQKTWLLDQEINNRGVFCRRETVEGMIWAIQGYEKHLLHRLDKVTKGQVKSARQVAVTRAYLEKHGAKLPNLQKETISQAVSEGVGDAKARKVLSIRQDLSRSSTAKYAALSAWTGEDSRIRGMLLFDGAERTGRWAGRGPQPHNLPRPAKKHTEEVIQELTQEMLELKGSDFKQIHGCPLELASSAIRSMIAAPPGKDLLCADFSSIEARVLAWLAGEKHVLKAFQDELDLYKVAAAQIYRTTYKKVTGEQRQIGKVAVLALGYQGGLNAFKSMGSSYGVNMPEDQIQEIVTAWRDGHEKITRYWALIEKAALKTMRNPGKAFSAGKIIMSYQDPFLYIRLPSGRRLSYVEPMLKKVETPWGKSRLALTYMGTEATTRQWVRLSTYGGKLVENITQAVARDLLRDAMFRVEKKGFEVIFHVHDELITEVSEDRSVKVLDRFCRLMAVVPSWAEGMPIAATGWRGKFYKKD